ncbi:hypothetical protein DFP72DRAFT_1079005 [Ephemerocybe angulata]|uniref:Nuclear condensin complex subunit 3 C-terminal domain-containing protein n=1 Tax=Ephemerocybe angulata TaxID=980116 RepID=A0A8H6HCZ7_9AGAR|nr:hypothetical protein DFP72DRAFT_1079005 [Tulosesus angulatus]
MQKRWGSEWELKPTRPLLDASILPPDDTAPSLMSLFRPDLWFPEAVDYPVQLLLRPIFLADYIAATLLSTLFLGVNLIACGYIVRQHIISRQRPSSAANRGTPNRWGTVAPSSGTWCYLSVGLVTLYTASVLVYCVAFSRRYLSVTTLNTFDKTQEEAMQWFRDNPEHDGVKMICIPGAVAPGGQDYCKLFKLTKNLLRYKGLEIAYASLVEALILAVDATLLYRFYVVFSTRRWVYLVVAMLSALSLAGPFIGFIALAKLASLGSKSDPWWTANFPQGGFLAWHSPWLAVVLHVLVNVAITFAIIARITGARRQMRSVGGNWPLRQLLCRINRRHLLSRRFRLRCLECWRRTLQRAGKGHIESIRFSPMILWVAFTDLDAIITNGLRDRESSIEAAAVEVINHWVKIYEEEESSRGALSALLRPIGLAKCDTAQLAVVERLLKTVFASRDDIVKNIKFPAKYWETPSPERVMLARVFFDWCRETDNEHRDTQDDLPAASSVQILITLFTFYLRPDWQDCLQLIQGLTCFFEMYARSSPHCRVTLQQIFVDVFKVSTKISVQDRIIHSSKLCTQFLKWTDPAIQEVALPSLEKLNQGVQLALAYDILKALFEVNRNPEDRFIKEDKRASVPDATSHSRSPLPDEVDELEISKIKVLAELLCKVGLFECRSIMSRVTASSKKALKGFETLFTSKYREMLEGISEEELRKDQGRLL